MENHSHDHTLLQARAADAEAAYLKRYGTLKKLLDGARYFRALRALEFAKRYHGGRFRKDGFTPEFDHYPEMHGFSRMRSGLASLISCCLGSVSQARRALAC